MLKFYDEGHRYVYNGEEIPSVSELLRFLSKEIYGEIDRYILDQAAERGTEVHLATQKLDESGTVEITEQIAPYIEAYALFLREHKVEWLYIEKAIAHPELLYAGTIDRVGEVDGKTTILDIKTNSAIKKPLVKAQLNGYQKLAGTIGMNVERLCCLQLMKNGKYRLYDVVTDDTEFLACYRLHSALKKTHSRGKIE